MIYVAEIEETVEVWASCLDGGDKSAYRNLVEKPFGEQLIFKTEKEMGG